MNTQNILLNQHKRAANYVAHRNRFKSGRFELWPSVTARANVSPDERLALETLKKHLLSMVKTNAQVTEKLKIAMTILYLSSAELR